jgi:hypothetical protein
MNEPVASGRLTTRTIQLASLSIRAPHFIFGGSHNPWSGRRQRKQSRARGEDASHGAK